MRLKIYHRTEYNYSKPVHYSIQELRLTPPELSNQSVVHWKINAPTKLTGSADAFGNLCHVFVTETLYSTMLIEAEGEILTSDKYIFDDYPDALSPYYSLLQTKLTEPSDDMLQVFKMDLPQDANPDGLIHLARRITEHVKYVSGSTDVTTTASQSFDIKSGVCQDHAHIMLGLCRASNIPARYVSGYFYASNSPNLASHAWVDVCTDLASGRWISLDVTHACVTDERYARLSIGRDYSYVAPVKGVRSGGGDEELQARIAIEEY